MPVRAAFYIDGFNLYHGIDDLGQPHLKWLDLWALGGLLIPSRSQTLSRVVWCTAVKTDDTPKMLRHRQLVAAQRAKGVRCLTGHFADETKECRNCGAAWNAPVEKQGDVNLALSLLDDAYRDLFDHAYLVTADGDQAAAVRIVKERFPEKRLTTIAPPNRRHNHEILALADGKIALGVDHLERCILPRAVMHGDGSGVAAIRPREYDPPAGWVAPDKRPRKAS